ncbi:hypothetical protein [Actinacidiphila oryziradicis]|jgi:hypothetical protein|uniref:hypothetical protein n=1 Tax=Actinacidiphila oryziradicis TaxID=2571141 RepID=UPI00145F11EE|nr:hypothetical protein [Actinacidiphila oryziradicis]
MTTPATGPNRSIDDNAAGTTAGVRRLPALILRRAAYSLAGAAGPAALALLQWWTHSH